MSQAVFRGPNLESYGSTQFWLFLGFQELGVGSKGQRPVLKQEMLLVFLSFRKLQVFYDLCTRTGSRDQYIFLIISQPSPGLWPRAWYSKTTYNSKDIGTLLESWAVTGDHFSSSSYRKERHINNVSQGRSLRMVRCHSILSGSKSRSGPDHPTDSSFQALDIIELRDNVISFSNLLWRY